jgi:predicted DNA-binding protein with PD1-like motif
VKTIAARLHPGDDLRLGAIAMARDAGLVAPVIVTCVGSLSRVALRMAGVPATTIFEDDFEIVSFVGTLAEDGPHLHLAVSDAAGRVIGGHAQEGNIVRTTAEIVIGELEDVIFTRSVDPATGWDELVIEPRTPRGQVDRPPPAG